MLPALTLAFIAAPLPTHYDTGPGMGVHFDSTAIAAGVSTMLPSDITINATTVTAKAVYQGDEATVSAWATDFGINLGVGGSGHAVASEDYFGRTAQVADGVGTGYWETDNASMDVDVGDFVFEAIIYTGSTNGRYASSRDSGAGWTLSRTGANTVAFESFDSGGSALIDNTYADGGWVHVLVVCDRSASQRLYIDGTVADDAASRTLTMSGGFGLGIGSDPDGTDIGDGRVAWVALWEQELWLDNHQQDAWALERYKTAFSIETMTPLLSTEITLNSVAVTAKAAYQGDAASTRIWLPTIGVDILPSGIGQTVEEETFFSTTGLAASGTASGSWITSDTFADITTGDFVIEAIVYTGTTASEYYAATRVSGAGFFIQRNSANSIRMYLHDGSGASLLTNAATDSTWVHLIVVSDRSGSTRMYLDGLPVRTTASRTGSMASGSGLGILSGPTTGNRGTGGIAWLAIWEGTNTWLDTHDQDAWAAARYGTL